MKRKTFEVPAGPKKPQPRDRTPFFSFGETTPSGIYVPELRDVTQPVCFDEHGQPVYAPRGFVVRSDR